MLLYIHNNELDYYFILYCLTIYWPDSGIMEFYLYLMGFFFSILAPVLREQSPSVTYMKEDSMQKEK